MWIKDLQIRGRSAPIGLVTPYPSGNLSVEQNARDGTGRGSNLGWSCSFSKAYYIDLSSIGPENDCHPSWVEFKELLINL